MRFVRTSVVLFLLLSTGLLIAQTTEAPVPADAPKPPRPRIGLALSGGGALGLAEIGVIRWLEENRIPVDRVAGTSMGGIIGAMYATGMSPDEIQKFAEAIDWDDAFSPEPTYSQLSFRRKQDRREFLINTPLGFKHGLNGPNGFNPGLGVGLLLDRIALPVSGVATFDDLPIPFRCVATDMLSGNAVVLHDGSLAQAVRASMAIPGVFTPVEIGDKVLADGGMVQNIPVETVRDMGSEQIIAVELELAAGTRSQLETLTGVLTRALDVMVTQNEKRSLAQAQATITVNTAGFAVADYSRLKDLIDFGYHSAQDRADTLRRYSISEAEWQQYLAQRAARRHPWPAKVAAITVTGADADTNRRIQKRLEKNLGGAVDFARLDTQLSRISGEGQFDRLGYEGFTQNGVPSLRVTAHEKSYGPPFLDLAVNVDGSGVGAFNFSAGGRITFMDIADRGGEWRNTLLFGSSNLAATEYYQPIANSRFFAAPYAFASKTARNSFSGLTRVAVFGDERAGGGFDFGYDSGRRSEFRIGYEIFSGRLSPIIGDAGLPIVGGSTGEFRARYVFDGQDRPTVPGRGTRVVATLAHVLQSPGQEHAVTQLDVESSSFFPLSKKSSVFIAASGGTTFTGNAGPFQVFGIGGPFRLGAYLPQEFIGNHYAYTSVGYRRELLRLPQLVGHSVYWGGWYEAGTAFGNATDNTGPIVVRGSVNLGVIADTIVGPIALAASASPTGQTRINFSIGHLF